MIYSRCLLPKRVGHVYKMGVSRALCPLWSASGALLSLALPEAVVLLFSLPLALPLDVTPPESPLWTSPPQPPLGEAFLRVFRGARSPALDETFSTLPEFCFFFLSHGHRVDTWPPAS